MAQAQPLDPQVGSLHVLGKALARLAVTARLEAMDPLPPIAGAPDMTCVVSYAGALHFGLTACCDTLPHLQLEAAA